MNGLLFGYGSLYGLLIAAAIFLAVLVLKRDEKRLGLPKGLAEDMALWCVPLGILGARIYYVAFEFERYAHEPLRMLYIWEGGLAIYGGVIGGVIACWLLARRRKLPLYTLLDMLAPVVLMAQAIGRWGNYFNGEAYGYGVDNAMWQFFPVAVYVGGEWHMATFFYESMWNAVGAALLYRARTRVNRRGTLLYGYLLYYGAGRMVIEGLRTDSLMLGALRVSQGLSVVMCAVAVWVLWRRSENRRALAPCLSALALVLTLLAALLPLWLGARTAVMACAAALFLIAGRVVWPRKPKQQTGSLTSCESC